MRHKMKVKQKIDLMILAAANAGAWMMHIESALKICLLVITVGYAIDRWIYWRRNRDKKPLVEEKLL